MLVGLVEAGISNDTANNVQCVGVHIITATWPLISHICTITTVTDSEQNK